jgi:hypothetical protein
MADGWEEVGARPAVMKRALMALPERESQTWRWLPVKGAVTANEAGIGARGEGG